MDREAAVEAVGAVLLVHDWKGTGAYCICGEKLWGEGKPTMTRHRAEMIVDGLAIENDAVATRKR